MMEGDLDYKKAILELIQLRTTCRIRGLDVDIKTQSNPDFFMGAKDVMETLHRHLDDLKWIIVDIECAMKYLDDDEKKKFKKLVKEIKESESFVGHVQACRNSEFEGIDCLENNEQFGFFKSRNDIRPSSCTWIDKEDVEKLFELFAETRQEETKNV